MRVFFHTLGCKVNRYETEKMLEELSSIGFVLTNDAKSADLIVVNSCTVTAESDRKTRQLTRRYKRQNENAALLLTGCMPQAFPADAEKLPADIILGNSNDRDIVSAVRDFFKNKNRLINVYPHQKGETFETGVLEDFSERTRAYMKIEDGCDRGCTYCIIPKARGRVRSRSLEDIKTEAENLAKNGFSEIVLVGINLSSFGKDSPLSLADAVKTVASVSGIERVRLGSLEPDLTDDELLSKLKEIKEFCPQFHLSLQSGSDATLKRMNRLYTADEYYKLTQKIKSIWHNASITTDIMVGFIGESDEEFNESLEFAKKVGFLKAHIFPYSVRESTVAANMDVKQRVAEDIKNRRAAIMAEECDKASIKLLDSLKGEQRSVLFERFDGGFSHGYSEDYIPVYLENENLSGKIKTVEILGSFNDGVKAKIV
ncbi:MAG: tRNA (N(6)-L-threonylcarbamoyladenosine(37)-C(2))-methylthiotransferase MtaB [Clostridia bacterium]|nr:tRNA (N(6)-L-threonylcarbamoyladenosine(37)-C(2))-methylthiotransferase MtaB [Clostridia bacterium]